MKCIYRDAVKLRENEEEQLLLGCYGREDGQDLRRLQARVLEQKHQEELILLRKELERVKNKLETLQINHNLVKGVVVSSDIVVNTLREERDNALHLVNEITTKHKDMCIKAKDFESKYKNELRKALTKEKQYNVERDNARKLLHEFIIKHEDMCIKAEEFENKYKDSNIFANTMREERDNALKLLHEITTKHEDMCIKAKDFESKYKDSHIVANTMREKRDNALKLVHEITTKHKDMCIKAKDFESKYKNTHAFHMSTKAKDFEIKYENELILRKALLKENQELLKNKQELEIDVDAKRKERDNAIKLVNEITSKKVESSFICPILLEVMKDPQMTSDGHTYEGEAIRTWLNTGRNRSPMTNLELSHTNLVPNWALQSAIQNRFESSLLFDLV